MMSTASLRWAPFRSFREILHRSMILVVALEAHIIPALAKDLPSSLPRSEREAIDY